MKRWGKSPPRDRQRKRHGKPHREQDRIGTTRRETVSPLRAGRSGGLLEAARERRPRGMVAQGSFRAAGQNPAYRPTGISLPNLALDGWLRHAREHPWRDGWGVSWDGAPPAPGAVRSRGKPELAHQPAGDASAPRRPFMMRWTTRLKPLLSLHVFDLFRTVRGAPSAASEGLFPLTPMGSHDIPNSTVRCLPVDPIPSCRGCAAGS